VFDFLFLTPFSGFEFWQPGTLVLGGVYLPIPFIVQIAPLLNDVLAKFIAQFVQRVL
jgi:hypothetical protein